MTLSGPKLSAAAATFAIEAVDLMDRDTDPALLFFSEERTGAQLGRLADPAAMAAVLALQDDLVGVGYIAVMLGPDVEAGIGELPTAARYTLADFATHLETQRATTYTVQVSINKVAMGSRLGPISVYADRHFHFYLYTESVIARLQGGIESAASFWSDPAVPQVVALFDAIDLSAEGKLLRVVAGSAVTPAAFSSPPIGRDTERVSTARPKVVPWPRRWSGEVTPLHFELTYTAGAGTDVAIALQSQLAKLVVLHLCDQAYVADPIASSSITAMFRGGGYATTLTIDEHSIGIPLTNDDQAALIASVDWVYREPVPNARDWVADRLQLAQIIIARQLEIAQSAHPAEDELTGFIRIAHGLDNQLEHQWEAFIKGKLNDYAAKLAEVEQAASDTAAKYVERVAAIVKSVAETALAAIGVLVGTFIAAAFKDPFNSELFEVGLWVYAGYVVLVPLIWGQASHLYQFRRVDAVHAARTEQFASLVGKPIVDANEVVKTADRARSGFWSWWWFACFAYLALAVATVIAIEVVPDLVTS